MDVALPVKMGAWLMASVLQQRVEYYYFIGIATFIIYVTAYENRCVCGHGTYTHGCELSVKT